MFEDKNYLAVLKDFEDELNKLRKNPKSYLPALNEWLQKIDGKGHAVVSNSNEGMQEEKNAVLNAIKYLKKVKGTDKELKISKVLCKVAQMHAEDIGKHNMMSHKGSDHLSLSQRIYKFAEEVKDRSENLHFRGFDKPSD